MQRTNKKGKKNYLAWLLCSLAVLVLAVGILEWTNTTHLFHHESIEGRTQSDYTKGEPHTSSKSSGGTSTSGSSDKLDSSGEPVALVQPNGNFVSSHHVSLGANSRESSSCNTSPGASCTISFTKDGITKSLPTKVVDAGGATYWSWAPKELNLSSGSWKIQATAKIGSQTATASDALNLEVQE